MSQLSQGIMVEGRSELMRKGKEEERKKKKKKNGKTSESWRCSSTTSPPRLHTPIGGADRKIETTQRSKSNISTRFSFTSIWIVAVPFLFLQPLMRSIAAKGRGAQLHDRRARWIIATSLFSSLCRTADFTSCVVFAYLVQAYLALTRENVYRVPLFPRSILRSLIYDWLIWE